MVSDQSRSSLKLLYNISRELVSSLDLNTVLNRVLFLSIHNVGAERGSLITLGEDLCPGEGAIVIGEQLLPVTAEQMRDTLDHGLAGWVMRERKAVLLPDTTQDERWTRRPDDSAERSGSKSAICVPLLARDQLVGVMTIVHQQPGFFNSDHLQLIESIAALAGIAIHNAQLFDSLQASNLRYRQLFEDSIDPIFITDWNGHILEANTNAVRITGYSFEYLQKQSVFDLHKIPPGRMGDSLTQMVSGEDVTYESTLANLHNAFVAVEVHVRKVRFATGEVIQWLFRDISAWKELVGMREDLSAMIFHDLRSPLANIISSLDMLETLMPPNTLKSLSSVFDIAHRSTERLQRLTNSLLDINRLEAGQAITSRKNANIRALVVESIEAITPITESKQQVIRVDLPDNLPTVWVDTDMIKRVLINLLENATKFTPVGGTLAIMLVHKGEWVEFCVQDTGMGIPNEVQNLIFEKFTRLKVENFPKGLGIGLAYCRLAVQAHGGNIWVESQEGSGSNFYFTLPVGLRAD